MASIFSRVGDILKKNFQNTNTGFNKIIYNNKTNKNVLILLTILSKLSV
mgnify:CR=1 FL=1